MSDHAEELAAERLAALYGMSLEQARWTVAQTLDAFERAEWIPSCGVAARRPRPLRPHAAQEDVLAPDPETAEAEAEGAVTEEWSGFTLERAVLVRPRWRGPGRQR